MHYHIKKLAQSLIYFSIGMAIGGYAVLCMSMSSAEINTYVGSRVVKVFDKQGGGTGFAIRAKSGKTVIVTNEHVCNASSNKEIYFEKQSGKIYHTIIIERSKKTDLCVVDALTQLDGLNLSEKPDLKQGVHVLGHPFGWPLKHTFGYIFNRDVIQMPYPGGKTKNIDSYFATNLIAPGNSGSPAVNDLGEVVAVAFALEGPTSFLIPYEYLKEILSAY